MPASRHLPGGRGIRRAKESFIDQNESFSQRLNELPLAIQPWACPADPWNFKEVATYTANQLYLFAMPPAPYDLITDQVRLRVTTAAAASNARTAIYRLDFDTNTFSIIPGTEVQLVGTAIATVTGPLARPVRLAANNGYFLGFKASSALLEVASISSVVSAGIINSLQVADSAGALRQTINLNALTRTINSSVPGAIYLNRMWRDYV